MKNIQKDRFEFQSIGDKFSTRNYFQTDRLTKQDYFPRWSSLLYFDNVFINILMFENFK